VERVKTVADVGEDELIASFVPFLPQGGALIPSGDDAAVVALGDPRVVVTTDALVEELHFRRDWSSGADVGWRAVMQNAADVAAMGARPRGFVAAVTLPDHTPVAWVQDLARGLEHACRAVERAAGGPCGVVGGDLTGGEALVVAVTAFGEPVGEPITRAGARPGDTLAVAGTLGHSAAGLALLQAGMEPEDDVYRRPDPPLAAAIGCGATALMDISDGLLRDAGRLARASHVTLAFDALSPDETVMHAAQRLGRPELALQWTLSGGEDHSFLAAFPRKAVPEGFVPVGQVIPAGEHAVLVAGRAPLGPTGWDHFAH